MNKTQMVLYTILLISFFSTFTSCNGQINSKTQEEKTTAIGVTVSQIDKTIWVIYQDKKSNFWFGSKDNGVFYYNGQLLKHITIQDGLVSNEIRSFQEDSAGNIFIETERGVSKFDGQSLKTLQIANPESPSTDWRLEPNDLWFRIGFNKNGPYRFDGEYLHYLKFPKSPQEDEFNSKNKNASLRPFGLYSIYKDRKGFMWFGTSSLGLCRYDGKTLSWHYEEQLQTTPEGGDFGTRAIFEDKDGKFWINNTRFRYNVKPNSSINLGYSKENGIGYLNENNEMEFPFFHSITEDNEGNLWMVTYDNGVWKYNGKELIHYLIKDGITDVLLFTIYKDNKGVLWLGSHNAGVYKFNGNSFEKFFK
ncbi:ligand-binding sensor domain-containing protein [Flavobacterium sp. LB3P21]|uniref:ligand-binding sensor domain-containing protein n=1 Tax=Flavobacterium sp. LB3P21 TaxID=3401719 RepID=UPI003AAB9BC6